MASQSRTVFVTGAGAGEALVRRLPADGARVPPAARDAGRIRG